MYNRLFTSIVASSLWSESGDVCKVWVTLLAMKDKKGFVFGTPAGIARICALDIDDTKAILEKFESPDPESNDLERNPQNEGRRIERVNDGWRLLNNDYYAELATAEDRRTQSREGMRRLRSQQDESI
jgi:hypothetical protein